MKTIGAGELRTPVFLGKPVVVKDVAGGETLTWLEFQTWAKFEPLTGREWSTGAAVKDQVDCKVTVRLSDGWIPSARWRVRDAISSALYNLVAVMVQANGCAECLAKSAQGNADAR